MEKLVVKQAPLDKSQYYIAPQVYIWPGKYLHHDLKIYPSTFNNVSKTWPGYYATKAEAERYLRAYEVSQMEFTIRQCKMSPKRGWYIVTNEGRRNHLSIFVWDDLELHEGTGYDPRRHQIRFAPGYYPDKEWAEEILEQFKEKHMGFKNAQDNLEINVKLNGVNTPLHEISEETLLRIREASKPKPVPVFQVAESMYDKKPRLIVKLPKGRDFGKYSDKYVSFWLNTDGKAYIGDSDGDIGRMVRNCNYRNIRELRLDEV